MAALIVGVIGFIIGITRYGSSGGDSQNLYLPIIFACLGAVIGGIVDMIVSAVRGGKHRKWLFVIFFIITLICLAVTFYAFYANWSYVYSKGLNEVMKGNIIYGLVNMILFPFVAFIMYFSGGGVELSLILGYAFSLGYAVILCFIFAYSGAASTADDHRGKYKVTVNVNTGEEVGERVPLDAFTESFKENALIMLIIIVATLFCPFLAFAIGFVTCFYSKLEERFGVMAGIVAVITIMCYVALAIFGK